AVAERAQVVGSVLRLLRELLLIGQPLPRRPRAGLALVHASVRDPVWRGTDQLDGPRLGEPPLRLRHLGDDAIPGQAAGDEDDESLRARDAAAAERQRVDLDLEALAGSRARRRDLPGRRSPLAEFFPGAPRRLGLLFANRRRVAADPS